MFKYCISGLLYLLCWNVGIAQINVSSVQYCGPGKFTLTSTDPGCSSFRWLTVGGTEVGTGCVYTSDTTAFDQVMTVTDGTISREVNAFDDCTANACTSRGFPIVNIDFGTGINQRGTALDPSLTTYVYEDGTGSGINPDQSLNDGEYTIGNSITSNFQDGWHNVPEDHTVGDIGGYMMVVNADLTAGEFYRAKVDGLCEGGIYIFSAWVMNILSPTSVCRAGIPIDVRFVIEDKFGNVLGSTTTGNIPNGPIPTWVNYEFPFFIGVGQEELSLVLINAAPGGCGNDIALDDITFAPCGGGLSAQPFPDPICEDAPSLQLVGQHNLLVTNPPLQWEQSTDDGLTWTDISGANTALFSVPSPGFNNGDKFRLTTTLSTLTSCEAISNEITLQTKKCICPGDVSIAGAADLCNSSSSTKLSIGYQLGAEFSFDVLRNGAYYGTYTIDSLDASFDVDVNLTGTYTISNIVAGCPADSFDISGQGIVQNVTLNLIDDTIYTCPNIAQNINLTLPSGASRIDWYDTINGNIIQTGTNYTKPYLASELPTEIYPTAIFGSGYNFSNTEGAQYTWSNLPSKTRMSFTAETDLTIESVQIDVNRLISGSCRTGNQRYNFDLFQNGVATGQTYEFISACPGNGGAPSFETVPLNFSVTAGAGYEIRPRNAADFFMIYNLGNTWPKSVPSIITFPVSGEVASGAFFNWVINQNQQCDVAKISVLEDPDCCKGFVVNNLVTDDEVCSGDTVTLSTSDVGPVFLWEITGTGVTLLSGLTDRTLEVVLSGSDVTIDLTIKSADSCQNDTTVIIVVQPTPVAPNVADLTYCQDATATILSATGTNLKWYDSLGVVLGGGAPTPTTISAGTQKFSVTQSNALGCESPKAVIEIEVFPTPDLPIVSDTQFCKQSGLIQFSATGNGLLWYTSATGGTGVSTASNVDLNIVQTTTRYVSQTESGCEGPRALVEVRINSLPVPFITGAAGPLCPQSIEVYSAGSVGNTYGWSVIPDSVQNFTESNEQLTLTFSDVDIRIRLIEENAFGCLDSSFFNVDIRNISLPEILPPDGVCIGDTNEYRIVDRGGTMSWSVDNTNGQLLLPATGTNSVKVKGITAGVVNLTVNEVISTCPVSDVIEIEIYALPVINFTLPSSVCSNDNMIALSGMPLGGGFTIDGVVGSSIDPSVSSIHRRDTKQVQYDYTDANGCFNTIIKAVEIIKVPQVSVDIRDVEICLGDATTITATTDTTVGVYQLSWFRDGTPVSASSIINTAGVYHVDATYLGCSASSNKEILSILEIHVNAGGDYIVDEGNSVNISAHIILTPPSPSHIINLTEWYDMDTRFLLSSDQSFVYMPTEKEKYVLIEVENHIGCTDSDSALVKVRGSIHIPEIITTNGDGLNDVWFIENITDYPKSVTKVYNRWGNVVFEKTGYLNDWDGTLNGMPLPVATYYYVVELYDGFEEKPYTGSLTIMR